MSDRILDDKASLVRHIRCVNSDELIAEYVSEDETTIKFRHPMIVAEKEDPDTRVATVTLSKYVMFYDDDIILQKAHIMTQTLVMDEIRDYYFNSVEYSNKFIEPMILSEIDKVNKIMKENLEIPQDQIDAVMKTKKKRKKQTTAKLEDDTLVIIPAGRTLH